MPSPAVTDWEFWGSLKACRLPLGLLLDPAKVKNRHQMKEVSGSAYIFRMFGLFFSLRWPGLSEKLTEEEKKDLANFISAFDALPWKPLASHPHISELPDDDLSVPHMVAEKLDRRLWLRTDLALYPCIYRLCRGWQVFEPSSKKEKNKSNQALVTTATRYPLPRSHPGRSVDRWSRPLPPLRETRSEVASFSEHNPDWKPMLRLYEELCAAPGSELFGSAIMGGGLVLAARPDVEQDEGVILVYFDPRKRRFSISYRHRDVQPEHSEDCSEEDVGERLRLFLAYKFGVHSKQK